MKKFALIFAMMATVFASCSKNELPADEPTVRNPIKLNITVSNPNADDTKAAIKSDWVLNDVIQIWYDSNKQALPDLVVKYDGTNWVEDGTASVSGNNPSPSGFVKAVYSNNVAVAAKDPYTYSDATMSFNLLTWTFLTELQVVIKDITENYSNYTLSCARFASYEGFEVGDDSITAVVGAKGKSVAGIANSDGIAFAFATNDLWDVSGLFNFYLTTPAEGNKEYPATITVTSPGSKMKGLTTSYGKFTSSSAMRGAFTAGVGPDGVAGTKDDVIVRFAPGNLQATYTGSGYTWGFAAHQYDFIGAAAGNTTINSQTSGAKVDLFGWSTTGSLNNFGIHTSVHYENDVCTGDFRDWGETMGTGWRTLTSAEWDYLRSTRVGTTLCKYPVTVCGIANCFVLAPDGNTETIAASYDASAWAIAEANGYVCLPSAGMRTASEVVSTDLYYWSSTKGTGNAVFRIYLASGKSMVNSTDRWYGAAVRLVKPAN